MRKVMTAVLGLATSCGAAWAEGDGPPPGRIARPNSLGLELGGRAMLYSLQYDRVLTRRLSAGIGYMWLPTFNPDVEHGESGYYRLVPLCATVHLFDRASSPFVTGMATACYGCRPNRYSGAADASWSFVPEGGLGYEWRGRSGFVARLTAYGVGMPRRTGRETRLWVGLYLGGAFGP